MLMACGALCGLCGLIQFLVCRRYRAPRGDYGREAGGGGVHARTSILTPYRSPGWVSAILSASAKSRASRKVIAISGPSPVASTRPLLPSGPIL